MTSLDKCLSLSGLPVWMGIFDVRQHSERANTITSDLEKIQNEEVWISLVCPDPFSGVLTPKVTVFFGLFTNSYCGEKEVVSELTWAAFDFLQWRVYFNNNNFF